MRAIIRRRLLFKLLLQAGAGALLFLFFSYPGWTQNVTYTYDTLNRLIRVEYESGKVIEYTYDAAGNRTSMVIAGAEDADLLVTKAGTGSGTVTSSPAGINCGGDCTETYNSGTSVTLTATPAAGSAFAGWSGGGCSVAGACVLTMNASITLTATFNLRTPGSFTFTDDPLPPRSPVKALHFTELRQAINTLRSRNGLSAFPFTGTLTQRVTQIRAVHLTQMRGALNSVYVALVRTPPSYTDPTIVPKQTLIKKVHIEEIRTAVRAIE